MGEVTQCYYRQKPPKGYPADYYLWPKEQKRCKGKKTCAPPLPVPIKTKENLSAFLKKVQETVGVPTQRLPGSLEQLKAFLTAARQKGKIRWLGGGERGRASAVVAMVQREVRIAKNRDIFVLIGTGHGMPGQARLLNDIYLKLKGITLIGMEKDKENLDGENVQKFWEHYLLTGLSRPVTILAPPPNLTTPKELEEKNKRPLIAYKKCLNVVMTDIPYKIAHGKIKSSLPEEGYYHLMREVFAAMSIQQKLSDQKKNAVVVEGGSFHMHRSRLPAFIKYFNPNAKIFVVVFDGDVHVPSILFDKAVKELNWHNRSFILDLKDYPSKGDRFMEGDKVVYLATGGKERWDRSVVVGDGVLIHTMDPLF